LPTSAGQPWSLANVRGRNVILSFLGPANCLFCRAHVIRLIQARERIVQANAEVVLVAHHDPELMMSKMMHSLDLPFTLLFDSTRMAYRRWGLGTVKPSAFFVRPGLYLAIVRAWLGREKALGSAPDQTQMGGDFVVDGHGTLAFANRLRSFHDRAKVEDLLDVVKRLR
jgi:peroxiredoxin